MLGKSRKGPAPALRKHLHDLRAAQHAVSLNVEAAYLLSRNLDPAQARKLGHHLELAKKELARLATELEKLSAALQEA